MRFARIIVAALLLVAGHALAQQPTGKQTVSNASSLPATARDVDGTSVSRTVKDRFEHLVDHTSGWLNVGGSYGLTGAALATAQTDAASKGVGLLIAHPIVISTAAGTVSVPVRFEGGGKLTLNTGGSVTLTGAMDAPLAQVFALGTAADFTGLTFSAKVKEVVPQWWGAVGGGTVNDTPALLAMAATAYPAFLPYVAGGYKVTASVTFAASVRAEGSILASGIVSAPAVIIYKPVGTWPNNGIVVRGLMVVGDASAIANGTVGIQIDGAGHTIVESGATGCKHGALLRAYSVTLKDCNFQGNYSNLTGYAPTLGVAEINDIRIEGGRYSSPTGPYSIDLGTTPAGYASTAGGGNPHGSSLRITGLSIDGGGLRLDNLIGVKISTLYAETSPVTGANVTLGGSGDGYLRQVTIGESFFNSAKYAIKCMSGVDWLTIGPNHYRSITVSALSLATSTVIYRVKYASGTQVGSFAAGQEIGLAFPWLSPGQIVFAGLSLEPSGLVNGVQMVSGQAITRWFPAGIQLNGTNRTVATNADRVTYTTPSTAKAGTMSGGAGLFTFTTKADSYAFNGGDRLTGTGAASGTTFVRSVDWDAGTMFIDLVGAGAATVSQVAVTNATETIP